MLHVVLTLLLAHVPGLHWAVLVHAAPTPPQKPLSEQVRPSAQSRLLPQVEPAPPQIGSTVAFSLQTWLHVDFPPLQTPKPLLPHVSPTEN